MVKIPKYDKNDWDQIHEYVQNITSDRPDFSSDAIFIIPISMALLKSAEETEKLNKQLLWLTIILALLTAILIIKDIRTFLN
jgi:hypothetical protein